MYNCIMNVYLDDGTGNVRVNFWKQQTYKLLKQDDAGMSKIRENPENFERYKTELLGEQVKVLGNAKNNIMGRLEFTAELIFTNLDPDKEIEMLDHQKEIVLETNKYDAGTNEKTAASTSPKQEKTIKSNESEDEFEISEDFLE